MLDDPFNQWLLGGLALSALALAWAKWSSDQFDRKWGKDFSEPAKPKDDQLR